MYFARELGNAWRRWNSKSPTSKCSSLITVFTVPSNLLTGEFIEVSDSFRVSLTIPNCSLSFLLSFIKQDKRKSVLKQCWHSFVFVFCTRVWTRVWCDQSIAISSPHLYWKGPQQTNHIVGNLSIPCSWYHPWQSVVHCWYRADTCGRKIKESFYYWPIVIQSRLWFDFSFPPDLPYNVTPTVKPRTSLRFSVN